MPTLQKPRLGDHRDVSWTQRNPRRSKNLNSSGSRLASDPQKLSGAMNDLAVHMITGLSLGIGDLVEFLQQLMNSPPFVDPLGCTRRWLDRRGWADFTAIVRVHQRGPEVGFEVTNLLMKGT
ncbi:hypothetical protein CROQUDRAFT_132743 [Cronartium quercuum f. sp. fusiforme G11]|uniref:Uncharacterized protein n=1 Tax=Cronartium quercuum f. sp. fusiforme G11 TaxID=708437 RepID=A0A9P6NMV5_9BASI|nr:hypothetical protein CROQUDRAFT_132743 [Cronartium quercuum f. sp. fusiforme G11]